MQVAKRIAFRGERTLKLKDLAGFQKGSRVPVRADAFSQRYLGGIAHDDLKTKTDAVYNAIREHFGFKRKEMASSISPDGEAVIETPRFNYIARAAFADGDTSHVVLSQEFVPRDLEAVRESGFHKVFPNLFNALVVEWTDAVDMESVIDDLEDDPLPGTKMKVSSDAKLCEIAIDGFTGRVTLEATRLTVSGGQANAEKMLEQYLKFRDHLA